MKKLFLVIAALAFVLAFISCSKTGTANIPDQTKTIVLPSNGSSIVNATNQLAFRFFQSALQNDSSVSNKLISPLSIYLALSMAYNGTSNATMDSIANTLNLGGLSTDQLNTVCQSLISQFPAEDNLVQLGIANSIWYRQAGPQPLRGFLSTMQTDYSAYVQSLDFNNSTASANTINSWVSQKTNGKIPAIISVISPTDLMYLIDAVYFNGKWKNAFKTSDTYNDLFYLPNGNSESVPFMKQRLSTNYYFGSSFNIAELPYGGGGSFSMYVIQPSNPAQSVSNFTTSLNADSLRTAISLAHNGTLDIALPKWEYSYKIDDMKPELSALGMGIAFGDAADFSKMYDPAQQPAHISQAIHKAYIKVNEEGTEAAAVTVIGIVATVAPANPLVKLDHPFLYAIVEKQTGTVLFLGLINDPSQN